jgi:hypothetical protein
MRSTLKPSFALFTAALAANASAAIGTFHTDYSAYDRAFVTTDGVINPGEYINDPLTMSSATGAGGVLAAPGRLLFNIQQDTFSVGFAPGAPHAQTLVILLSSGGPGRTRGSGPGITTIDDQTDAARRALSTLRGAYPSHNLAGLNAFRADFAITMNADGVGLFAFPDDQHATFTQIGSYTGVRNPTTGVTEGTFPITPFGFFGAMGFTALYAGDSFLSNESIPAQPFNGGPNPGAQTGGPVDIPNFNLLGIFIPSPSLLALATLAMPLLARRRRCVRGL